jgi:hypothetical protein
MAVTTFHDFPLAPRDRAWHGTAAEKRVPAWAGAQDKPNHLAKYYKKTGETAPWERDR